MNKNEQKKYENENILSVFYWEQKQKTEYIQVIYSS